LTQTPLQSHQL
jgi:hypothetical protein